MAEAAMQTRVKQFVQQAAQTGAMPAAVAAHICSIMDGDDSAAKVRIFNNFAGLIQKQR